jgi:predicted nucleic acid-binding protein
MGVRGSARRGSRIGSRGVQLAEWLERPVEGGSKPTTAAESPGELEAAISAASHAELHFGVLVARSEDERASRSQRLGVIEATFNPLPLDAPVAREWGRLAAAVTSRGGKPRRRAVDLAIAATANVHDVPLLTCHPNDFALISDLVETRASASS